MPLPSVSTPAMAPPDDNADSLQNVVAHDVSETDVSETDVGDPDVGALSVDELRRYSRHLTLPGVGVEGQQRLKRARVLLVGAGGLGSPAALYLAAAGVGTLGLVDFDRVDVTNLQRQVLHGTRDIGRRKTESARDRLGDLNPHVHLETYDTALTSTNALEILRGYDVVVDGTDNFATRYLTNDACVLLGIPNVYGSVLRFEGQASLFAMPGGPCYRCLFREPPPPGLVPSCAEGGVFGVLPGLMGMIQATETLKLLLGVGETLAGRLLLVDALRMHFRTIALRPDPDCPACGTREITALQDYDAFCGAPPAASLPDESHARATTSESSMPLPDDSSFDPAALDDDADATGTAASGATAAPADHANAGGMRAMTATMLAERRARGDDLDVLDVREAWEYRIASIPGSRLVPLGTLAQVVRTIDPSRELVVLCHHGMRSAAAVEFLQGHGFTRIWNLTGGIDRWSTDVDPDVPRY